MIFMKAQASQAAVAEAEEKDESRQAQQGGNVDADVDFAFDRS